MGMNNSISPAIMVIGEILSFLFNEKARVGLDKRPRRKQQLCEHTVNGVGESGPMEVENALATHSYMPNELYAEGLVAFIEWMCCPTCLDNFCSYLQILSQCFFYSLYPLVYLLTEV